MTVDGQNMIVAPHERRTEKTAIAMFFPMTHWHMRRYRRVRPLFVMPMTREGEKEEVQGIETAKNRANNSEEARDIWSEL